MKNIIFSYRRFNNPWIFPFLHEKISGEGEVTAQSALRRVNRHLKKMGEQLHFEQPFTTYVMRHSWASMMLEANSEIGIISQSLGHMSLRTTEIYLGRISVSKIDRASDNMLNNLVRGSSSRQRSKNKVMALRDNLFTKINGILDIVHIIKDSHVAVCYRYTEVGTIRAGDIHRQLIMIIPIDIVIGH